MRHLVSEPSTVVQDNDDYLELVRRVEKVLPRSKSFAPWTYFFKIGLILSAAFCLEVYIHTTKSYQWPFMALEGFLFALIGMNVGHDSAHGAVSANHVINDLFGLSFSYMGGSRIMWIHVHDIQHHIHTNDVHLDPDMDSDVLYRLNPIRPLLKIHVFQHIYYFIILAAFAVQHIFMTLVRLITGTHFTPMSTLVTKYRLYESIFSVVFIFRWFVLPVLSAPTLSTFLGIGAFLLVEGYYLAFFFILSHNYQGVHMIHDSKGNQEQSFLYHQIVTASNVAGSWLAVLNGGLNYQIEHHLFPRISHSHYSTIAPVVRDFCKERGIPYVHFKNVVENVESTAKHLLELGTSVDPPSTKWIN